VPVHASSIPMAIDAEFERTLVVTQGAPLVLT
jgi:hypothetical protein